MSLLIKRAGLQTTIQAGPRRGRRHLGVPACGAADPLSLALANRLVGNAPDTAALEITLTGMDLKFEADCQFALTGAPCRIRLGRRSVQQHETVMAPAGATLRIGGALSGARTYFAVAGGLRAASVLGSVSTYVPAGLGGHQGRALADGDRIELLAPGKRSDTLSTPDNFRPPFTGAWALRTCYGAETGLLDSHARAALFDTNFTVGSRADRMGLQLEGRSLKVDSHGRLPSAAVFPGSVQCPENGTPFLLSVDAQTTGGYARVAQVARVDRHIIGQCRMGDHVRLIRRRPEAAIADLKEKLDYWSAWIPDIATAI